MLSSKTNVQTILFRRQGKNETHETNVHTSCLQRQAFSRFQIILLFIVCLDIIELFETFFRTFQNFSVVWKTADNTFLYHLELSPFVWTDLIFLKLLEKSIFENCWEFFRICQLSEKPPRIHSSIILWKSTHPCSPPKVPLSYPRKYISRNYYWWQSGELIIF